MKRAIICVVVCWATVAFAGKPKLAILGLEVIPPSTGAPDNDTVRVAEQICIKQSIDVTK